MPFPVKYHDTQFVGPLLGQPGLNSPAALRRDPPHELCLCLYLLFLYAQHTATKGPGALVPFIGSVCFPVIAVSIQALSRPWDAARSCQAQGERDVYGGLILIHKMLFYLWGGLDTFPFT